MGLTEDMMKFSNHNHQSPDCHWCSLANVTPNPVLVDESTLREQLAREIEARKLLVIEQSKIGLQPEDSDFYRKIFERSFDDAAAIARGDK